MGIRRDLINKYDTPQRRQDIIGRDGGRCVKCHAPYWEIHEAISRSAWASTDRDMGLCFSKKNSACVCREHHHYYQGNYEHTKELLEMLHGRYSYDYSEIEFRRYL